jgi:hypothetical protein
VLEVALPDDSTFKDAVSSHNFQIASINLRHLQSIQLHNNFNRHRHHIHPEDLPHNAITAANWATLRAIAEAHQRKKLSILHFIHHMQLRTSMLVCQSGTWIAGLLVM